MNDVLALSGIAQARLIRNGKISPAELMRAHLERIGEVNPALNAVIHRIDPAAVLPQRGPLAGVPFSVKDSIEVAGTVCTAGTLGYRNNPPSTRDATLVARLRRMGAIPIAKTNLPDLLFAFESDNLIHGRTNNPYDLARTSGGSSGGEAALIAACGTPFGLGSDAAGSVRLPAHYCGIASLKPTSGRLPRTGHVPPAGGWIETLWQIGPMARRVEDLSAMMQILSGPDGEDRTVIPVPSRRPARLATIRVAFFIDNGIAAPDPATAATVRAAAKALEGRVLSIEQFRPPAVDRSYEIEMQFLGADGGDGLRRFAASIGSVPTHPLLDGWLAKLEKYRTDIAGLQGYWSDFDSFRTDMFGCLRDFDAIVSPVASQPAVPHGKSIDDAVFPGYSYTMTHNLTGWPAAVVRCGASPEGLPIGVQIAAAPWREDVTLTVGEALEEALGGWQPAMGKWTQDLP